ncbi:MAG: RNA polymerase sigma factor [Planctomycetaceae bacterium]|nr:RNA polymerase sigma factor [Planctomycetaceae bacterium]
MHDSDRNLIEAHLGGQAGAFETLIGRHGPALLGYLTKMTHDRDHAEDLFQETFVRAHERARQFRGENLKPWLFAIASRIATSGFRRIKRHAAISLNRPVLCADGVHCQTLEQTVADRSPGPDARAQLEEKRQKVRQALGKLPAKQRSALILSYYHQMTYLQIAKAMGCSVGAVKTHLFRALKKLSALLAEPAGGLQ